MRSAASRWRSTPTSAGRPTRSRRRAEDVPDVDAAANNFDMISYAKGNAALRQLVTWLGDEAFLAGLNAYLTRHRLGNATLADFVSALDEVSERDVRDWAERVAADHRLRHDPGQSRRRGAGADPRGHPAAPHPGDGVRRRAGRGRQPLRRPRRRAGAARRTGPAWSSYPTATGRPSRGWCSTSSRGRRWCAGCRRLDDPLVRAVLWTTAFGLVRSRELSADGLPRPGVAAPARPSARSRSSPRRRYARTRGAVVQRLPASATGGARAAGQVLPTAALAATDDDAGRIELTRGQAARRPRRRPSCGAGSTRVPPTPASSSTRRCAGRSVHRLAALGAPRSRRHRGGARSATARSRADLGAATARAAIPTPRRRPRPGRWSTEDERIFQPDAEAGLRRACSTPSRPTWWRRTSPPTLAEAPRLARRGPGLRRSEVDRAFPAVALSAEQLRDVRGGASGRPADACSAGGWEDRLDDARRGLPSG